MTASLLRLFSLTAILTSSVVFGQPSRAVDAQNLNERIIVVVPWVGSGTYSDPKRPLFVPLNETERTQMGLISHSVQSSDDGKHAIVEFVTRTQAPFAEILADKRVVASFMKGKHKKSDIEKELRKHAKDWILDPREKARGGK